MNDVLAAVPPALQVAALTALGAYVAVTVIGRLVPRIGRRIFDPERDFRSLDHVIEYTGIPALVLAGGVAVVATSWDASRPWLGDWSAARVVAVGGLVAYAFVAVMTGTALGRRIDTSDARRLSSWIPLLLLASGIAALVGAVFAMP